MHYVPVVTQAKTVSEGSIRLKLGGRRASLLSLLFTATMISCLGDESPGISDGQLVANITRIMRGIFTTHDNKRGRK